MIMTKLRVFEVIQFLNFYVQKELVPLDIVANVQDCYIVVSEFKLYIHF